MFESSDGEGGVQGIWNRVLSVFNTGKEEVIRSSKVSKARLDISSLKKERRLVFERLGEELYKRRKEKSISISGFAPFFTEIEIISNNLSDKDRELKELKGEAVALPSAAGTGDESGTRSKKEGHEPDIKVTEVAQS